MKLYQHQIKVLDETKAMRRVAYYLDMGLGKTYVGSEKMFQLNEMVNLVVCQKSKINDWFNHFVENYSGRGVIFNNLTNKNEFEYFLSVARQGATQIIGIINYELAWRRKRLLELNDFTLMLDESSLIQNDRAKQSKFILKLDPANVILLSGTPTAGKYERLWTQAHLLGWKISKRTYEDTYINWDLLDIGGTKVRVVSKRHPYKNVDRLKRKFREHGAVFMKTEDVLNLPEQNFITVMVDKAKTYDKFMKTGHLVLDTKNLVEWKGESDFYWKDATPKIELIGNTTLTTRLYLRMLASQYNENKIKALKDLIESTNDRLIVFYNFNAELETLTGICEALKRPVSVVNGEHKDLLAYENYSDSISLIQYQAGSMGLNLQKANKIIYFSLPERSELFEQSKKRIHRIGQKQPCFYYVLMATGTIDNNIYGALKQRKDFTDFLFKEVIKRDN